MADLPENRLATTEEAADFFSTTTEALAVQRHRGQNPGNLGIRVGRRVLYSPDTMREWFAGREQERQSAGFIGREQELQNLDAN